MRLGNCPGPNYALPVDKHGETLEEYVARWRRIGPELERERRELFAPENAAGSIRAFDGLVLQTLKTYPPSPDSGLIEQQRLFRKLRHA
jgi:hypothetical protein